MERVIIRGQAYWSDNSNLWNANMFSEAEAEKCAASLEKCRICINCADCQNCTRCTDCRGCFWCHRCERCNACRECQWCEDCTSLKGKSLVRPFLQLAC